MLILQYFLHLQWRQDSYGCSLRCDLMIGELTNINSRWGVKHPLGRYLPICSMWHAVFNTCTVEEFMHGPMHKNDTPWIVAQ